MDFRGARKMSSYKQLVIKDLLITAFIFLIPGDWSAILSVWIIVHLIVLHQYLKYKPIEVRTDEVLQEVCNAGHASETCV